MTYGRIINGEKYMHLFNDNNFKSESLNTNVYFTLRDIFANADSADTVMEANSFNSKLTGDICFEDRTENFAYTNVLSDVKFLSRLLTWLNYFSIGYFEFIEPESDETINMCEYMRWEDWWAQFEELKQMIKTKYEQCLMAQADTTC